MKQPIILIIGGGASGLAAAIAAKTTNRDCQVTILEKQPRLGKKLLATGNGRCNLGNSQATAANYYDHNGNQPALAEPALQAFPPASNQAFFQAMGLLIKEETAGKQYPYNNQAASVLDLLRLKLDRLQVEVHTDTAVTGILQQKQGFQVQTNQGAFFCHKLILACGGVASPQLSNSLGFSKITNQLGLHTTPTFPALVQLKLNSPLPKALKGQKLDAVVTLTQGEKLLQKQTGEVLFTDYGISGPPVFQLSHLVSRNFAAATPQAQTVSLDLMPEYTQAEVQELLQQARKTLTTTLENFLIGLLPKRIGQQVLKHSGLAPLSRQAATLKAGELKTIAAAIKNLTLPVSGTTGWQNAQVTAGGLHNSHFYPSTLEAKNLPGLYACGELLDVYGDCGGYNLTWAWSSGRLAGTSAAGGNHA